MSQSEQKPKNNCFVMSSDLQNGRIRPSTRIRILSVLRNFHSVERIQKVADLHVCFAGCVWTEGESAKKKLRIQNYPVQSLTSADDRFTFNAK